LANRKLAGVCLGLAVAARLEFAIPAALLGLALYRGWDDWTNRIFIPAVVSALIVLVLPLSHAHAGAESAPKLTLSQAAHFKAAVDALPRGEPIRIQTLPQLEPMLNFYRAQYRATKWSMIGPFDYYLLPATGATQPDLTVLHRDADFVVAAPL